MNKESDVALRELLTEKKNTSKAVEETNNEGDPDSTNLVRENRPKISGVPHSTVFC